MKNSQSSWHLDSKDTRHALSHCLHV
jgi:hypothetical protein